MPLPPGEQEFGEEQWKEGKDPFALDTDDRVGFSFGRDSSMDFGSTTETTDGGTTTTTKDGSTTYFKRDGTKNPPKPRIVPQGTRDTDFKLPDGSTWKQPVEIQSKNFTVNDGRYGVQRMKTAPIAWANRPETAESKAASHFLMVSILPYD